MRFYTRLISMCLTFCMLITTLFIMPFTVNAVEQNSYYADVLSALGIYEPEDNMNIENEGINREELASIISIFCGVSDLSYLSKTTFDDVPEYWASGHIMTVVQHGLMNGYDDGLFRPKRYVSGAEVLKVLVNLTGYEVLAEAKGGYPAGYFAAADSIKILKGVEISDWNADIKRKDFTRLLYNAVHVDLLKQTATGTKNKYGTKKDKNLLSEKLDIYQIEGNLKGVFGTSVDFGKNPGSNKIRIDDEEFFCYFNPYQYIGMNVNGYFRYSSNDAIGEVIYLEADDKTQDYIEVDTEHLVSLTSHELAYEDGDKVRTADIPNDVIIVYNGKRTTYATVASLKPSQGNVKLIDANSDGTYEYLIINNYINYFVENIIEEDGKYTIKDKSGKRPIVIDTKADEVFVTVTDRDRLVEIDDIKEFDVISIMADSIDFAKNEIKSDSTVFSICRFDNKVYGKLTAVSTEEIFIDDAEYELDKYYNAEKYPLIIDTEYTFYLNHLGKVCAAEPTTDASRYGILQAHNISGSLALSCKLRIYDQDGIFIDADCTENARLDGAKKDSFDDVILHLKNASSEFSMQTGIEVPSGGVWQLVKYVVNKENEILSIDTILPNKNGAEDVIVYMGETNDGSLTNWLATTKVYMQNGTKSTKASSYGIDNDVVIFQVGTDKTKLENHSIFKYSSIRSETIQMKFFDGGEMGVAKAVIRCSNTTNSVYAQESTNLMILEKITDKIDANGDVAPHMIGTLIRTGEKAEVPLEAKSLLTDAGINLGDFVQWTLNYNGVASAVRRPLGADGTGSSMTYPGGNFTYALRLSYGKAMAKSEDRIKIAFDHLTDDNFDYEESCITQYLKRVYVYDSARKTLTEVSADNIRTAKHYGIDGADTLASYYISGQLTTIVIYR